MPEALAEIMTEIDAANRLAAKAAEGDREALRDYVETDPALSGLDRLYCMEVADAMIRMHGDVLTRLTGGLSDRPPDPLRKDELFVSCE